MTDEVVTRLHRALVEELRDRGHPEDRPVTVADLYQTLVPYRAVRSRLGLDLNADYEHALLRLLAGEGDLLHLEPARAREELEREVRSPYPVVGLFRKFSDSSVRVRMPPVEEDAAAVSSEPVRSVPPVRLATLPPDDDAPRAPARAPVRLHGTGGTGGTDAEEAAEEEAAGAEAVPRPGTVELHPGGDCVFCGDALPAGHRVRFCPYCGADQRLRPCPRCDAVVEREWRYCISCGHEAGGD